jgi:hypothetical protein
MRCCQSYIASIINASLAALLALNVEYVEVAD